MRRTILGALVIFTSACSLNRFDELDQSNIGYIGDYSNFQQIQTNDGLKTFRYASDRIKSGIYRSVILEPVAFYPEEVTSDQVSEDLLMEVKAYIDLKLLEVLATHFEIVQEPQADALTIVPRVTAIRTTAGDLRMREMIPIGSIIALGKAAAGYRHQNVEVYMEIKAIDSLNGEFVGGSVKQGKGAQISDSSEQVTLNSLKPLLEVWIKDANDAFGKLRAIQKPVLR